MRALTWPVDRRRGVVRFLARAVLAAVIVSALSLAAPESLLAEAGAQAWIVDTHARTEAQIREAWSTLTPTYTGTPYVTVPSATAPYAPGETTAAFREDGLKMLNFGRYLAGLPSDVTLLDSHNLDAQYGAVLASKEFSHTPAQPVDMPDDFYERGYASTSSSNLGRGHQDLESFQKSCLSDEDASNIDRVGHRRWIFSTRMLYTGMGSAQSGWSRTSATYAFDQSRAADAIDYAFIAWPSAGLFPVEQTSRLLPWSVTLNPNRYDWDTSGHTVQLRRVSDGKTWTLDASDTNRSGEYFNAEFGNYGFTANAFIFRPLPADLPVGYRAGEQYDVTLSGGIYAEGTRTPVTVKYRTSFCALSGAETVFAAPTTISDATPAPEPGVPPVAVADRYETPLDTSLVVAAPGVLKNDTHPKDGALTAETIRNPTYGALLLQADGSFRYYPRSGWSGTDTFTYKAKSPDGAYSTSQTVTITVKAPQSTPTLKVTPVEGAGRIETAIAASRLGFATSKYVVVATARSFPDALGGSSLAGVLDAPILLTEPGVLPDVVKAEIARLKATNVIVLGGEGAVSQDVYTALAKVPGVTKVERIWGASRYETADKVAGRTIAIMGAAWDGTAFTATGESFPDALGASPIAAAKGWPIYLVHPNAARHAPLITTMKGVGVRSVLILGGTGPIPASFETRANAAFTDALVTRLDGKDRYATAVKVATYGVTSAGLSWSRAAIATGQDFPDALSGGTLQAASGSVLLLTPTATLDAGVENALKSNKAAIAEVRFLGGAGAVIPAVRTRVRSALAR